MTTHSMYAPALATGRKGFGLERAWAAVCAMLQARQTRLALAEMDARLLSDIGVGRAEAAWEANRPFWDIAGR